MSNKIPRRELAGLLLGKPRPKIVRNPHGVPLLCMYRDCQDPGSDDIRIGTPAMDPQWPGQLTIKIFCSQRHKQMYIDDNVKRNRLG